MEKEELTSGQYYFVFSSVIDKTTGKRMNLGDCYDFVDKWGYERTHISFELENDDDEEETMSAGFIEEPYYLMYNQELFEVNVDDPENDTEFCSYGDGQIQIKSSHPNFKNIVEDVCRSGDFFYDIGFNEITSEEFVESIKGQKDFDLLMIELDVD